MVTAVRTSALLTAAPARPRAVAAGRPGRDPAADLHGRARRPRPRPDARRDHEHLQQGAGYERVQVVLDPEAIRRKADGRTIRRSPWSRRDGSSAPSSSRPPRARPERAGLLRMFSESVALVVRNANLHASSRRPSPSWRTSSSRRPSPSWRLIRSGRVVTWNPAAERMFGRGADEARGKLLGDAMPAAVMVQLEPVLAAPRASRTVVLRLQQEGDRAAQDLTATARPSWGGRTNGSS